MPRHYPEYNEHKASGRAVLQWAPLFGPGKKKYLRGKFNSTESLEHYAEIRRKIDEMAGAPPAAEEPKPKGPITVARLIVRYMKHAADFYKGSSQLVHVRIAARILNKIAGQLPVKEFGPKALKKVRDEMLTKGWTRNHVNANVSRVRRIFKWGVADESVDESVYARLKLLDGLRKGKTTARDNPKKRPVKWGAVKPVLRFVSPTVADLVRLQWLCGARSDELTSIRHRDIDRTGDVWIITPDEHKTAWLGKEKVICFGPKAQRIIRRRPGGQNDYLFRPADSLREHYQRRAKNGVLPMVPRRAKQRFDARSYQHAITHGFLRYAKAIGKGECPRKFNEKTKRWAPEKPIQWLKSVGIAHWHPHQIRHSRATATKAKYGPEGAQAQLGNSLKASEIYARPALALAQRIARETG